MHTSAGTNRGEQRVGRARKAVLLLGFGLLIGCQGVPGSRPSSVEGVGAGDSSTVGLGAEPADGDAWQVYGRPTWAGLVAGGASTAELRGRADRLKVDIERAAADAHWAVLRVVDRRAEPLLAPPDEPGVGFSAPTVAVDPPAVRAWLALPDSRRAVVVVRVTPVGQGEGSASSQGTGPAEAESSVSRDTVRPIWAAVKVGHFGDAEAERAFLRAYQRRLEGEPPRAGIGFKVPRLAWPELPDLPARLPTSLPSLEQLLDQSGESSGAGADDAGVGEGDGEDEGADAR